VRENARESPFEEIPVPPIFPIITRKEFTLPSPLNGERD
jgi:hypothetical protein